MGSSKQERRKEVTSRSALFQWLLAVQRKLFLCSTFLDGGSLWVFLFFLKRIPWLRISKRENFWHPGFWLRLFCITSQSTCPLLARHRLTFSSINNTGSQTGGTSLTFGPSSIPSLPSSFGFAWLKSGLFEPWDFPKEMGFPSLQKVALWEASWSQQSWSSF